MNHSSVQFHRAVFKFSIRTLLILTVLGAIVAWDLGRQRAFDQAVDRFSSVFPGSFCIPDQPIGLRQLQRQVYAFVGLRISNQRLKTLELYPQDPTAVAALTAEQSRLLSSLPPARYIIVNNFEFSLKDVTLRLRSDCDNQLALGGCRLKGSSIADLRLPHLRNLSLDSCADVSGLDKIGDSLPHLNSFTLNFCAHVENLPAILSQCRQLESLQLAGPNIDDASIRGIENLSQLKALSIWDAPLGDVSLMKLDRLEQLKSVQLRNTRVTDVTLRTLSRLSKLQHLILSESRGLTDEGLQHLLGKVNLEDLKIDGIPNISDRSAECMGSLVGLTELWLHGTGIGRVTVQKISRLPKLQELILDRHQFQEEDILPLAKSELQQIHCKVPNRPLDGFTLTRSDLRRLAGLE